MENPRSDAPPPDLRIVITDSLHPHEEHDSQRSQPLIDRLQQETIVINPPIVSQIGASQFLILDGANRFHAFSHLGYPHILVQVVSYDSGYVGLRTWKHVVCAWDSTAFLQHLHQLESISLKEGIHAHSLAHIVLPSGQVQAVLCPIDHTQGRNAALCDVVHIYQQHARLQRTALTEPDDIWLQHPDAVAIVEFPEYTPADIIAAARHNAFIPPGISRHIIHGRALRVNYPLDELRDEHRKLQQKNERLQQWMQSKLANRQIRYYAEATYQFDE
jgi:hypothetical protein